MPRQGSLPPNFTQPPPPLPTYSRWDSLNDGQMSRGPPQNVPQNQGGQQQGAGWSGNNRWDNRTDYGNNNKNWGIEANKENWTVPLPRNERMEKYVYKVPYYKLAMSVVVCRSMVKSLRVVILKY